MDTPNPPVVDAPVATDATTTTSTTDQTPAPVSPPEAQVEGAPVPAAPAVAETTAPEATTEPVQPDADADAKDRPWDDPVTAKDTIERLRRENAASRTEAKTKAADEARTEVLTALAATAGIEGEVTVEAITAALEAARNEVAEVRREALLTTGALRAGVDVDGLTDSRSFMTSIEAVTDVEGMQAAIATALETNPALKIAATVGAAASGPVDTPTGAPNPSNGVDAHLERLIAERRRR